MAEDISDSRQLAKTIEQLIDAQPNDQRLRDHLEGLTRNTLFPGLTWFWGPRLYQRNRVIFRPLMLEHFSNWMVLKSGRWQRVQTFFHRARDFRGRNCRFPACFKPVVKSQAAAGLVDAENCQSVS